MEERRLNSLSAYAGSCIVLTTKHAKSLAIAPPFWEQLKASVIEYVVDTDQMGTFSGEIKRQGTPLECARKKCEWCLQKPNTKIEFALASEGTFGPHPLIPFVPCNHEILYFIDKRYDFHLSLSQVSLKSNYARRRVHSWEELQEFAKTVQFPSHALILRSTNKPSKNPIFKGLNTQQALKEAFLSAKNSTKNGPIWVETDMRAHVNPSRMQVIRELAKKLASRLASLCPACNLPGWGQVELKEGLACKTCKSATKLIKQEIFGCVKCPYRETRKRADKKEYANPKNCQYCNP